jgi:hypothetical protein
MALNAMKFLSQDKLKPARFPEKARKIAVRLPGGVTYPKGTVLGFTNTAQQNEVQTITISATGGTFAVGAMNMLGSYDYTPPLAYNVSIANFQAALDNLIGPANCVVTGTAGTTYTISLQNDYANVNAAPFLTTSALTGGAGTATVAETTKGSPGIGVSAAAYASGNSDGSQVATCVLEALTRTDGAGRVIGEFSMVGVMSVPAFIEGHFLCSDLVGLDATSLASLGKLVAGTVYTQAGAMISIR